MASVNGEFIGFLAPYEVYQVQTGNVKSDSLGPAITYIYQMVCTDAINTNQANWIVQGTPDNNAATTAAATAISNAGLNTPVRNIRIMAFWTSPIV